MISLIDSHDFIPFGRHHVNTNYGHRNGQLPERNTSHMDRNLTPLSGLEEMTLSDTDVWMMRPDTEEDEEIYIKDKTLIWSRGQSSGSMKCLTMENRIKQAGWCLFHLPDDGKLKEIEQNGIFILYDDNGGHQGMRHSLINVYIDNGREYIAALPFLASQVHVMKDGLVIERTVVAGETKGEMPVLFSLLHPLDEVSPIVSKGSRTANAKIHFTSWQQKLLFISDQPSLALTFDPQPGLHSLWLVRRAKMEEAVFQHENLQTSQTHMETPQKKSYNSSSSHSKLTISNTQSPSMSPYNRFLGSRLDSPRDSRLSCSPGFSHSLSHSHSPSISMGASGLLRYQSQSPPQLMVGTPPSTPIISSTNMTDTMVTEGEPVFPDICFEYVWSEKTSRELIRGSAVKAAISKDFCGQEYLCFLVSAGEQLRCVKFEESNDRSQLIFGAMQIIPAKDFISLPKLDMMIILEQPSCDLALYSGTMRISRLHVHGNQPSLLKTPLNKTMMTSSRPVSSLNQVQFAEPVNLPSPVASDLNESSRLVLAESFDEYHFMTRDGSSITGVRDPVGERFSVQTSDGACWRTSLTKMANTPLVRLCLHAIKQVLPKDLSLSILSKWYCVQNAPGNNNQSEWSKFAKFLYTTMGFDTGKLTITQQELDLSTSPVLQAKKARGSDEGSNDDWTYLINSEHHRYTTVSLGPVLGLEPVESRSKQQRTSSEAQMDDSAILFNHIPAVFFALHIVHEEIRLKTLYREDLKSLCLLLFHLARNLRLDEYSSLYCLQSADLVHLFEERIQIQQYQLQKLQRPTYLTETPPDVFKWLYDCLRNQVLDSFPYLPTVNETTKLIINMYTLLLCDVVKPLSWNQYLKQIPVSGRRKSVDQSSLTITHEFRNSYQRLTLYMAENHIDMEKLQNVHFGIALPLQDALYRCRSNPPSSWPEQAYRLIGRQDLAAQTRSFPAKIRTKTSDVDDGMDTLDSSILSLRFSEDRRIDEVRRLLQSSKPIKIILTQKPEVSDHEFIEEQENMLYSYCIRTIALPVGRGMITMRTSQPNAGETMRIPDLCLTGKAPPRNNTIDLSHTDTPANMTVWPKFHNGVATGLCLDDTTKIDSTWIMYNKLQSTELTNEHAGFLFALGLNNHLNILDTLNIHDYLMKGHELTSIALLLGISAAKRGTMDIATTRLLSIHLDALLPPTSTDLDIRHSLKVAAIFGIGLVYQGTAHRHMAEVLLSEIGRPPGPEMDNCSDRESYSLSAGLALGMVMLGRANDVTGLSDLNIPDHLYNYMTGGHKRPLIGANRDRFKSGSYQVKEGANVNVDVTAPGATLALGLMFFKTGKKAVCEWLKAPDTQFLLHFVRPDFLMLRVIAKALVQWDDIVPCKDWVEGNVPDIVARFALRISVDDNQDIDYETMSQAYLNIIAGGCFAMGLRFAGSANQSAYNCLLVYCRKFVKYLDTPSVIAQAKKNIIENCTVVVLLSTAMVMAGTGDLEVLRLCRHLRSRVGPMYNFVMYGSYLAISQAIGLLFLAGGRYSLSTKPESVAAMIAAFYPMFPTHSTDNRYHLQALRHLYVLASEPRLMIPQRVDTLEYCSVNIHVGFTDTDYYSDKEYKCWAPCILPELSLLKFVKLSGEAFQSVCFDEGNLSTLRKILRENGGLVPVKCRPQIDLESAAKLQHQQVVSDPVVAEFTEAFVCKNDDYYKQMIENLVVECVNKEKTEVLSTHVALDQLLRTFSAQGKMVDLWQIKFILTYCSNQDQSQSLLHSDFLIYLKSRLLSIMESYAEKSQNALREYLSSGSIRDHRVALFITWFDLTRCRKLGLQELPAAEGLASLLKYFSSMGLPMSSSVMIIKLLRSS